MDINEQLVNQAREVVIKNYDEINQNHTVGACLLCGSGKTYVGINIYTSIHSACAEYIAFGNAIANGEKEFLKIVAVAGKNGEYIVPPCGNCRQMMNKYAKNIEVILADEKGKIMTKKNSELLPYAYDEKPRIEK